MASPSLKTVKRLFAVSHNRCAFEGCINPMVEESGTVTGEIAHICAASENGPRFDPNQTESERHHFSNLLLLCSRHHTIIDAEVDEYSIEVLLQLKKGHEQQGAIEISPASATVATKLIQKFEQLTIINGSGNVAVQSPGAIQAQTVNLQSKTKTVKFNPPSNAIGSDADMASYIEYLIGKYQHYQKLDVEKQGRGKYTIIYNAIKREFGCKWQTVSTRDFEKLMLLIQRRIKNSKIGRIRNARGQKLYHSYEEHLEKHDA